MEDNNDKKAYKIANGGGVGGDFVNTFFLYNYEL